MHVVCDTIAINCDKSSKKLHIFCHLNPQSTQNLRNLKEKFRNSFKKRDIVAAGWEFNCKMKGSQQPCFYIGI